MKIVLQQTDICAAGLKELLLNELRGHLKELDLEKTYKVSLLFDETASMLWTKAEEFVIPAEALPRYLRDKELKGKEKIYELLSYQLRQAEECTEACGIKSFHFSVTGMSLQDPDSLELWLEEDSSGYGKEERDESRKRKKECPPKVYSIMPSMRSFGKNLAELERRWTEELVKAFGDRKIYENYEKILGWGRLRMILNGVKTDYGCTAFLFLGEKEKVQAEFLRRVKAEADSGAGAAGDSTEKAGTEKTGAERADGRPADGAGEEAGTEFRTAGRGRKDGLGEEERLAVICTFPVLRLTKSGKPGKRRAGTAELVTDGRTIRLRMTGKVSVAARPVSDAELSASGAARLGSDAASSAPAATLSVRADGERAGTNAQLLSEIRQMIRQADEWLRKQELALDTEPAEQILAFMDLKGMLRKIRLDRLPGPGRAGKTVRAGEADGRAGKISRTGNAAGSAPERKQESRK